MVNGLIYCQSGLLLEKGHRCIYMYRLLEKVEFYNNDVISIFNIKRRERVTAWGWFFFDTGRILFWKELIGATVKSK